MGYGGYLVKFGDYTIPNSLIKQDTFSSYVNMQDKDPWTDENGYEHRDAVELKALKVEFETKAMLTEKQFDDFWKNIEKNEKVPGESYKFIDLLELSGIITKLRDWSNATLFTETPEIVLNFSTVIPVKARKAFAGYIEEKLGKVRSYSIEVNDLLSSKIIYDHQTLAPAFGDQLVIIQSAGRDILLSVQTWCGDQFMQGDEPVKLKKKGMELLNKSYKKL